MSLVIATLLRTSGGGPGFLMKKEIGVNPALISSTTFLAFILVKVLTALVVINPAASAYASRRFRLTASFLAASNFAVSSFSLVRAWDNGVNPLISPWRGLKNEVFGRMLVF